MKWLVLMRRSVFTTRYGLNVYIHCRVDLRIPSKCGMSYYLRGQEQRSSVTLTICLSSWLHIPEDLNLLVNNHLDAQFVMYYTFSPLHRAYCLIHSYFTNTCTCDSHYISVNTLIVKMDKTLKLLALQHVSVFRKTILREPFVPIKVTFVHYYFRSLLAACL